MTAPPPVTLCIVNYNGAQHLRAALQAVRAQDWPFAELLLVDNASTDDSPEVARTVYPDITLVQLPQNLGPGAARNAGFRAAAHDLILFQDNDICLQSCAAAQLTEHLQTRPEALLVAPRVLYAHDPDTVQYDSADCHFLGLMTTRHADASAHDLDACSSDTTSMVSACFLIDRGRWDGGDLFDESFGFNLEDHDFGVRAGVAGYSLRVLPRAIVHHGSGTPGLSWRPGLAAGEQRLYYLTLNRWTVISKCYARRTLAILFPVLLLFELMQFGWHVSNGTFRVWLRAARVYWNSLHDIRAKRRAIQRDRKVPDRDILRDAPLPLTLAVRGDAVAEFIVASADRLLRGYWRLVRRRI